jgi:membrane-associated phospholipid phosphatase
LKTTLRLLPALACAVTAASGRAATPATLHLSYRPAAIGDAAGPSAGGAVVYHGPGSLRNDSFPSGHMAAATASAVVLGHQYPRYKLLFYGLAAGVGIARIEHRNHWPSDVYWGAGVGYYGGWQSIRNKDAILQWRF